ncbi:hypothetical protein BT96DRAFT_1014586 [Gymnopus androsaceus JB14]|uniref:Uncharacterized protein n=1 Tax=Gymnopus androsaceus JB14 TaxID=1447944 RepID=A0A6A4I8L6_9AGAR|nr:hypothetical protein BT96DRAFT_1014586 [Gymnopus androsaceus JB14]
MTLPTLRAVASTIMLPTNVTAVWTDSSTSKIFNVQSNSMVGFAARAHLSQLISPLPNGDCEIIPSGSFQNIKNAVVTFHPSGTTLMDKMFNKFNEAAEARQTELLTKLKEDKNKEVEAQNKEKDVILTRICEMEEAHKKELEEQDNVIDTLKKNIGAHLDRIQTLEKEAGAHLDKIQMLEKEIDRLGGSLNDWFTISDPGDVAGYAIRQRNLVDNVQSLFAHQLQLEFSHPNLASLAFRRALGDSTHVQDRLEAAKTLLQACNIHLPSDPALILLVDDGRREPGNQVANHRFSQNWYMEIVHKQGGNEELINILYPPS